MLSEPVDNKSSSSILETLSRPSGDHRDTNGLSDTAPITSNESEVRDAVPHHPLGVKPSGNGLTASFHLRPSIGSLQALPDELILSLLFRLDSAELRALGSTCKALYAFTRAEELWKDLFIEKSPDQFTWLGTWRSTCLNLPPSKVAWPDCSHLFSDALHHPFFCANISLAPYVSNIPARNQIPVLPDLSPAEFEESWTDKPFILTEPVGEWPIYSSWTEESFVNKHARTTFRAEETVDWPLENYIQYMKDNSDESPLYLFDRNFVAKMDLPTEGETAAFTSPACFGDDYFAVLGDQRPDHRWLIVGPGRSGSKFHKDPNATSAWNAVLRGSKYWIMFPGTTTPPGVYVSTDQSEVTSPLSIAEWLLNFHAAARKSAGCMEGICGEGEVLHIPSGWWHLVVNLDMSSAVTQNFIPHKHLAATLDFLKNKPDQVTGFKSDVKDPYALFVERMQAVYPDSLEAGMKEMEGKKKRKWDEVVKGTEDDDKADEAGGFSFGFGDDGSDVEVP